MDSKRLFVFMCVCTLALSVLSCKKETISLDKVLADKILKYYYIESKNSDSTYVTAEYLTESSISKSDYAPSGGKSVILTGKSSVSLNGRVLPGEESRMAGMQYKTRLDKWPGTFSFQWKDASGKVQTDTVTMDRVRLKSNLLVNRGGSARVEWLGAPVGPGEKVTVTVTRDRKKYTGSTGQIGAKSVFVRMPYSLSYKAYKIEIMRTRVMHHRGKAATDKAEAGSLVRMKYISKI